MQPSFRIAKIHLNSAAIRHLIETKNVKVEPGRNAKTLFTTAAVQIPRARARAVKIVFKEALHKPALHTYCEAGHRKRVTWIVHSKLQQVMPTTSCKPHKKCKRRFSEKYWSSMTFWSYLPSLSMRPLESSKYKGTGILLFWHAFAERANATLGVNWRCTPKLWGVCFNELSLYSCTHHKEIAGAKPLHCFPNGIQSSRTVSLQRKRNSDLSELERSKPKLAWCNLEICINMRRGSAQWRKMYIVKSQKMNWPELLMQCSNKGHIQSVRKTFKTSSLATVMSSDCFIGTSHLQVHCCSTTELCTPQTAEISLIQLIKTKSLTHCADSKSLSHLPNQPKRHQRTPNVMSRLKSLQIN